MLYVERNYKWNGRALQVERTLQVERILQVDLTRLGLINVGHRSWPWPSVDVLSELRLRQVARRLRRSSWRKPRRRVEHRFMPSLSLSLSSA
jgi:hypothetical protein